MSGLDGAGLPVDVVVECVLSLLLGVVGCVWWSGSMSPVRAAPTFHMRSADSVYGQPDFRSFQHRGKALKASRTVATLKGASSGG